MSRTVHHVVYKHRAGTSADEKWCERAEHVPYMYRWFAREADPRCSWHELWDIRYPAGSAPRKIRCYFATYSHVRSYGYPIAAATRQREHAARAALRTWRHETVKIVRGDPDAAYDVDAPEARHRGSAIWDAI